MIHRYPSLAAATLAVVRIYGPIAEPEILREVKNMPRQLPLPYSADATRMAISRLLTDGEIVVMAGLYQDKRAQGDVFVRRSA